MNEEIEIIRGSDNVFKDLGLPNAETLHLKAKLAAKIIGALNEKKMKGQKAAKTLKISEADISRIRNADLKRFTIDRLVEVLNRLSLQVEISFTKAA
ncbi:MAG: helix-turn-helix transcriptional regulator [Nitrospirota bacterium]|nr:helix-turn-helix transcriptional regulator [Nitrospirota bacterium]